MVKNVKAEVIIALCTVLLQSSVGMQCNLQCKSLLQFQPPDLPFILKHPGCYPRNSGFIGLTHLKIRRKKMHLS